LAQKYVVLKTLITHALCIFAPQFLVEENTHLMKSLLLNGYYIAQMNRAFFSANNPKPKTSTPPRALLTLPYIQGTIDHIDQLMAKNNIKAMFKPYKNLKQLFIIAKDKSNPMLGPGVYQIPCSCEKSYIGQTGRSFKSRLKEHIQKKKYFR
jgi:hypothetical protein